MKPMVRVLKGTKYVLVNGEWKTYREVAAILGISRAAVSGRVAMGRPVMDERSDSRSNEKAAIRRRIPTGSKVCLQCQAVFMRRTNESTIDFAKRGTCGIKCSHAIRRRRYTVLGVSMTAHEIAEMLGITLTAVRMRLYHHGSPFLSNAMVRP